MDIIEQSWSFEDEIKGIEILKKIERAGRTCYKSEELITEDSAQDFVKRMIKSGHHSVIEHHNITVRIVTDRGVSHEIVRHRLASYSQESTRYCNYSADKFGKELTVILPVWFKDEPYNTDSSIDYSEEFSVWEKACREAERYYFLLLNECKQSPQQARAVLPNSLKTELVMTCNLREWRHFFNLRCSSAAHPQIRELALDMLKGFHQVLPVVFQDLYDNYIGVKEYFNTLLKNK